MKRLEEFCLSLLSKKKKKKRTLYSSYVAKIVQMFGRDGKNLINLRFVSMCLLGYFGFLRYSELANLIRSFIRIFQDRLEFFISKAKLTSLRKVHG